MSISCQFTAEGAVRFPESGRFIPNAAHRRLESTWRGSFSVLNEREEPLSFKTCMSGLPPSTCGFNSCTGIGVSAKGTVAYRSETAKNDDARRREEFFIIFLQKD